jgi:hypothetical protein
MIGAAYKEYMTGNMAAYYKTNDNNRKHGRTKQEWLLNSTSTNSQFVILNYMSI